LITEQAITFIKGKHTKPFFLSLQYTAPHWPWQAPGDGPSPDSIPIQQKAKPGTYAAMVKNLDENIGKFLQALQANGLANSTLIIFTSDNGGEAYSDMGPFKGKKMELWEGGIRVPAAVRWPGIVKPGSESNQPVITMDWTVTILEAAQTKYPEDWDGMNLIPLLKGDTSVVPRSFYWRTANRVQAHAFRQGDWKYLHTAKGEFLFNLAQDPYESRDLKEQMPGQLATLKAAFTQLNNQMLPPLVLAVPPGK
jgi:arylsulfatase A-like enzyme